MRPDEHKKKKSAQYQRKHGGGGGARGGKNENDKTSSKSGKSSSSKDEKSAHATRSTPQEKAVDISSDSEDEGHNTETRNKTFRRREVASNWAKYDIPPVEADDSTATARGQDFNKLLQAAGSAVAHFRFKDEEGWEEDGKGDNATTAAAQVLSLDCTQLAASLDCLPLYTQLHLDTDIFTPEQLAAMDKTADEHRALAGLPMQDPKENQTAPRSNTKSSPPAVPGASPRAPEAAKTPDTPTTPSATQQQENSATDTVNSKTRDAENGPAGGQAGKPVPCQGGVGFSDADLDSLLESSDTEDKQRGGEGVSGSAKAVSVVGGEVTEQDLDDLLSMETPQSGGPGQVSDPNQKVKESNTTAESAELEDWLDSVLDT